ncbi:MAG: hypothetical protein WAR37_04065 [Candidatus Microsaccharimonas sp.]
MAGNQDAEARRKQAEIDAAKAKVEAFSHKQYEPGDRVAKGNAERELREVVAKHAK